MSGLREWLSRGDRTAFIRFGLWVVGIGVAIGLGVPYFTWGREYVRTKSPNQRWNAVASESAGKFRVWVQRAGLERSPMDLVWSARGVRPVRLQWIEEDSLVVIVNERETALKHVILGNPVHEFVHMGKGGGTIDSMMSVERIGVSTTFMPPSVVAP